MAERDLPSRLRRAVKENNLFLVKRLIQRTGMRNPDPDNKRYTSLAWAGIYGHEETFEFLLSAGHDDEEHSKDSDNNTILILLADVKSQSVSSPYRTTPSDRDLLGATLRMAKLYYDRYPYILDWSNLQGRTALHVAALKGDEELVRMLCDLGADYDLADNDGNTPLHYASAWGHVPIVQLLIERGCTYVAKNNEGFSASDYAYSFSTKDTLQDTARVQFEQHKQNKKARRNVFAQAAARGGEWRSDSPSPPPRPVPSKQRSQPRDLAQHPSLRTRSGSGASRSTATSDSSDLPAPLRHQPSYSSISTTSSPSQSSAHPSVGSFFSRHHTPQPTTASSNDTLHSPAPSQSSSLHPPPSNGSALSPVASRMRERDADAMEKYLKARGRQRSGSADTMSTEAKSQNDSTTYSSANGDTKFISAGPSSNGDDITALANLNLTGSVAPRRRLRPSASASQLGSTVQPSSTPSHDVGGHRSRSGTSPADLALQANGVIRPAPSQPPTSATLTPPAERTLFTSPSPTQNVSPRPVMPRMNSSGRDRGGFTGPPAEYAKFPGPPPEARGARELSPPPAKTPTQSSSRRLPFKLSKSSGGSMDSSTGGHRRGGSATSVVPTLSSVRGLL